MAWSEVTYDEALMPDSITWSGTVALVTDIPPASGHGEAFIDSATPSQALIVVDDVAEEAMRVVLAGINMYPISGWPPNP